MRKRLSYWTGSFAVCFSLISSVYGAEEEGWSDVSIPGLHVEAYDEVIEGDFLGLKDKGFDIYVIAIEVNIGDPEDNHDFREVTIYLHADNMNGVRALMGVTQKDYEVNIQQKNKHDVKYSVGLELGVVKQILSNFSFGFGSESLVAFNRNIKLVEMYKSPSTLVWKFILNDEVDHEIERGHAVLVGLISVPISLEKIELKAIAKCKKHTFLSIGSGCVGHQNNHVEEVKSSTQREGIDEPTRNINEAPLVDIYPVSERVSYEGHEERADVLNCNDNDIAISGGFECRKGNPGCDSFHVYRSRKSGLSQWLINSKNSLNDTMVADLELYCLRQ